jgi:leucine dehydrogenase
MYTNEFFDDHERVVFLHDHQTGLRAIVAIHSTALGPAGGGCRIWQYPSVKDGLSDALKLSRGMSFKNALAGLPMGGGKAVIFGPLSADTRADAFRAFGKAVNDLAGGYVTAEDVGVSVADMQIVASVTPFVSGLSAGNGAGGDPSPYTARGVCLGIEAAVLHNLKRRSLEGLRVAIQGLGGVGSNLARELSLRGAKLIVADIDPHKVEKICDQFAAKRAPVEKVLLADVDVVAPCALGGAITEQVALALQAPIVAGGANNQISSREAGNTLRRRQITYAPDYVVNAGGIIMVAAEYYGNNDQARVDDAVSGIHYRTLELLERSAREFRFSGDVADEMARAVIGKAAATRGSQILHASAQA